MPLMNSLTIVSSSTNSWLFLANCYLKQIVYYNTIDFVLIPDTFELVWEWDQCNAKGVIRRRCHLERFLGWCLCCWIGSAMCVLLARVILYASYVGHYLILSCSLSITYPSFYFCFKNSLQSIYLRVIDLCTHNNFFASFLSLWNDSLYGWEGKLVWMWDSCRWCWTMLLASSSSEFVC